MSGYAWALGLHVIAATVWTGGHIVLATTVLPRAMRARDAAVLSEFETGYERIGIPAFVVQLITGLWLASIRLGSLGEIFADHPVARLVQIKLALLLFTAVLAFDARFRLIPKLADDGLRAMAWHIVPVTLASVGFVIVGVAFRFGGF
ncbi:CopD family protein [Congregicoccus parvus]|uniref:CopD family protein n=1 Tax=Congregicoccus parvus TaxID=3081749 RepID=UPI003FA54DC0